jgi:hypothetical protein
MPVRCVVEPEVGIRSASALPPHRRPEPTRDPARCFDPELADDVAADIDDLGAAIGCAVNRYDPAMSGNISRPTVRPDLGCLRN